jgi:uncharacterized membrane protein (UPF0127 family)
MAKWLRIVLVGCLLGFGGALLGKVFTDNPISCGSNYRKDTIVQSAVSTIDAEVANTDVQRVKGLSNRQCIGADQGMLFVFEREDILDIWMKDMKFPIDIVWVSSNKTVNHVETYVSPKTYPKIFNSKTPSLYVLELQAGRSKTLNITEGTNLQFDIR